MLDTSNLNRGPFDVSTIEDEMSEVFKASHNPDRDPLLNEREQTHGGFAQNAAMWDSILFAMDGAKFSKPEHRLALSMICLKIARAAQHPDFRDHWDDIAGYAKLAAEACSR